MVPQDIQTDTAIGVDVGVVDAGGEVDLWRLEWVVGREVNSEEENASRVWRVTLSDNEYVSACYETSRVETREYSGNTRPSTFPSRYSQHKIGKQTYGTHNRCLPMEL